MTKKLDTNSIANELKGASAYFQKQPEPDGSDQIDNQVLSADHKVEEPVEPPSLPKSLPTDAKAAGTLEASQSSRDEVRTDVKTSILHDVNKRALRKIIEETEALNSSLRMSLAEREQVEDTLLDLRRNHKIKTSMNELARLGLLILLHDFKKNGKQSIITEVKTS